MSIFENKITIENRKLLEEYMSGFEYKTSGLSFSSMYMWRNINNFTYEIIGDYMCIAGISHMELEHGIEENFLHPPLTKTGSYDTKKLRETIYEAKRLFGEKGCGFSLRLIPSHMQGIIEAACPDELRYIDDRPNYDYIYKTEDLISLKGRKYHSKKNHLNYFTRNYEYEYVPLDSSMADEVKPFLEEFFKRKGASESEMKMLKLEERAMHDVFENLEAAGFIAGAIKIGGKIEALSVGGRLGKDTVTIHVEKANTDHRGLYQAINREFCMHAGKNAEFINREEDMGNLNLRKAKLSYRPHELLEKYQAVFIR